MERTPVISSDISSIGYDLLARCLEVQFHTGSIHHYFEVPADEHRGLMTAASHGKYLASRIKPRYGYQRMA